MPRCKGTCVTGRRCKKTVSNGELCSVHRPKEMVDCSICMNEIVKNSNLNVKLECEHIFCKDCIYRWIVENNNSSSCPCCRASISLYHHKTANIWGLTNNYLFSSVTHYYNFNVLPEIDALILITYLYSGEIIERYVMTDKEFRVIEENMKNNINFYEIFKILKEKVIIKHKLIPVKSFPDKPESMHIFIF